MMDIKDADYLSKTMRFGLYLKEGVRLSSLLSVKPLKEVFLSSSHSSPPSNERIVLNLGGSTRVTFNGGALQTWKQQIEFSAQSEAISAVCVCV